MVSSVLLLMVGAVVSPITASSPSPTTTCVASRLGGMKEDFACNESDPGYQQATDIDNSRCRVDPLVVAWPMGEGDVALALAAAHECGVPFSVVSGGHGAAGYELLSEGLTLSLAKYLSTVQVDNATGVATAGPGATFDLVYGNVPPQWVPVGGRCSMVAPGGFLLGGG